MILDQVNFFGAFHNHLTLRPSQVCRFDYQTSDSNCQYLWRKINSTTDDLDQYSKKKIPKAQSSPVNRIRRDKKWKKKESEKAWQWSAWNIQQESETRYSFFQSVAIALIWWSCCWCPPSHFVVLYPPAIFANLSITFFHNFKWLTNFWPISNFQWQLKKLDFYTIKTKISPLVHFPSLSSLRCVVDLERVKKAEKSKIKFLFAGEFFLRLSYFV